MIFRFYPRARSACLPRCSRDYFQRRVFAITQVSCQHTGAREPSRQQAGHAALTENIFPVDRDTVIMERHADGPPGVDNQDSSLWGGRGGQLLQVLQRVEARQLSPPGRMRQGAAWSRDLGSAVQAQAELRLRQSSRQGREV